jgi:hypothetical protein
MVSLAYSQLHESSIAQPVQPLEAWQHRVLSIRVTALDEATETARARTLSVAGSAEPIAFVHPQFVDRVGATTSYLDESVDQVDASELDDDFAANDPSSGIDNLDGVVRHRVASIDASCGTQYERS